MLQTQTETQSVIVLSSSLLCNTLVIMQKKSDLYFQKH